ncbi:hypothetical protein BJX63DRAFT_431798 [Aspergillus granulosus]|uniref:Yip1 domain-containing protein n=1 Tax=Aspergillus granulosus TaxID=176169 RepID=A0ABR4HDW3_9EURO
MKSPIQILASCLGFTWVTSYNTLEVIGRDGITKEEAKVWIDYKKSELNFTATIGTLLTSVIAASLSWSGVETTHWVVPAFWYNAAILAIFSAIMAFHQSSALGYVLAKVLHGGSLGNALLKKGTLMPSRAAVFVLQAPIQLLTYGIAMYLIGYLVYVVYPISQAGYPAEPAKIALFFGILLTTSCGFFVISLVLLQRLIDGM